MGQPCSNENQPAGEIENAVPVYCAAVTVSVVLTVVPFAAEI